MSISLTSVVTVTGNTLRAQFSEPFNQDAELFTKSNYAFRTRFGVDVPIYAKSISVYSVSEVTILLQDVMLEGGNYEVTVKGVSAISDGVRIEDGGGNYVYNFTGLGEPLGCFEIRNRIPPWLNSRFGSTLHALLCATGERLDVIGGRDETSEIRDVQKSLVLRTATGKDLGVIGANYGVSRPEFVSNDDDLFRKLIPLFATKRKAVINIFYEALTAVFGPAATSGWAIFETSPNVLTVELPADLYFGLAPGGLDNATYLHDGDTGPTILESGPPVEEVGHSTSVGLNFLTDTAKTWITNHWSPTPNAILIDSAGTRFTITSNTVDTLTVSGTPAAGSYQILRPCLSTTLNQLNDTSKAWTTNEWAGKYLLSSAGVRYTISSNTATRLVVSGTPSAGPYVITSNMSAGIGTLRDTNKAWATDEWAGAVLLDALGNSYNITGNTAAQLNLSSGTPKYGPYTILRTLAATYPGDYFLADETVDGSTIDDNIIVLFQQTVVDDITDRLKASGIQIVVVVRG